MQQTIQIDLADGVRLTIVHTEQFKTSVMRLGVLLPLGDDNASCYAALPHVLRRGTARYPDMLSLGEALDDLYGARVEASVRKCGDALVIGFLSDVIDEKYVMGGNDLTARAAALLASFWQEPHCIGGVFSPDYVTGERENLMDCIAAQKNEPRAWAPRRLHEIMCDGEPFGKNELGTIEGARLLRPDALYSVYCDIRDAARIELFYCGSMPPAQVEEAFRAATQLRHVVSRADLPQVMLAEPLAAVRTITEQVNMRQSKLSMGFRTGVTIRDAGYPAMLLMNTIWGGSVSSKLFMNVREKYSLCYYASSALDTQKGIITVSSGIENENFARTQEEILHQLTDIQGGAISDRELETARNTARSGLRAMQDSPISLEAYWLGQAVANQSIAPDALYHALDTVTRDDIIDAANRVKLDTVFFLEGATQ